MDTNYWTGRKHAAMAMARNAKTAEARLIHYDLAGRYSIRAASSLPFLLPSKGPATPGEREALRTPLPRPGSISPERPATLSSPGPIEGGACR